MMENVFTDDIDNIKKGVKLQKKLLEMQHGMIEFQDEYIKYLEKANKFNVNAVYFMSAFVIINALYNIFRG